MSQSAVRMLAQQVPKLTRPLKTSAQSMGGNNGYYYDFEHGKHSLDLINLPNKKVKVAAWIFGVVGTGVGIPLLACWYQQSKLRGA